MLVINRVRVLGSGPHTPTQFVLEYPPPPPPGLNHPQLLNLFTVAKLPYKLRSIDKTKHLITCKYTTPLSTLSVVKWHWTKTQQKVQLFLISYKHRSAGTLWFVKGVHRQDNGKAWSRKFKSFVVSVLPYIQTSSQAWQRLGMGSSYYRFVVYRAGYWLLVQFWRDLSVTFGRI